jgi:hypothetical protein
VVSAASGASRRRWLALFGLSWLMNGLATGYFLFFFAVLVGLWVLWFARAMRDWVAIGVTILVASLPLVPLLVGYLHYQSAFGLSRSMQEIEFFSADLSALWATTPYVWPHLWTLQPGPEGELYPGATILGLAIVAAVVLWRRARPDRGSRVQPWLLAATTVLGVVTYLSWRGGGWSLHLAGMNISLTRPMKTVLVTFLLLVATVFWNPRVVGAWRRGSTFFFYSVAAALMLLFALGPVAHVFKTPVLIQAPYYWLMQLPGGHALRVPARFAMLLALCLSVAAALAFARLSSRGARPLVTAAICVAVLAEGFVSAMGVAKVPPPLDLAGLDHGGVVLELPITDDYADTAAMLHATGSGHTLVNGFSGYLPPHYEILKDGLGAADASVITALQQFGPLLVFVRQDADREGRYRDYIADVPGAHRVLTTAAGSLFQFPSRVPFRPDSDRALHVSAAHANAGAPAVDLMIDDDLGTRWQTPFHQVGGNEVTIDLDRDAAIARVELDLGPFKTDYPRKLRIGVVQDNGAVDTVWEGRTTGLAMIASLIDRQRMPLVFDLAPLTRGRRIVLTVLDGHPEYSWSIAELKVFGH